MKKFLLLLIAVPALGVTGGAGHPKDATVNANTSPVGTTYTHANNSVITDAAGVSAFSVYNGSSLGTLGIAFPLGSRTCQSADADLQNQEFSVPASTGLVIDGKHVAINKIVCIRSKSTGSSLTSGFVDITVW